MQAALQQTPWEQKPDLHLSAELHSAPFRLLPQDPSLQVLGGTQSESLEQLERQTLPLHTKGSHPRDGGAWHWPVALQVGASVKMLWLSQLETPHLVVPAG